MTSPKKELEIIYNLQWKNTPSNGDDKANIVGMQDIPATTLTWNAFKSYLLKNSGVPGNDVEVSYIDSRNKEFRIDSQMKFQIAMYSFRQRARNGEIITLKLDRISTMKFPHDANKYMRIQRDQVESEEIPLWFDQRMKQMKEEIKEEVTNAVLNAMSNMKVYCSHQAPNLRKSKSDFAKRPRKTITGIIGEAIDKEKIKACRIERKIDRKFDKLALKMRDRKCPLIVQNDAMDAIAVKDVMVTQRKVGGDMFYQEWEVANVGTNPWTSETELRYSWGSTGIQPLSKSIQCPLLKPHEIGKVGLYIQVCTNKPGLYESYFHFLHRGCRFGVWLGCRVVVEMPKLEPIAGLPTSPISSISKLVPNRAKKQKTETVICISSSNDSDSDAAKPVEKATVVTSADKIVDDSEPRLSEIAIVDHLSSSLEHLGIPEKDDIENTFDSDNQSIVSINGSNSENFSDSEYELIQNFKMEKPEEETNLNTVEQVDTKDENVEDKQHEVDNNQNNAEKEFKDKKEVEDNGYAYVNFNGEKIRVPKHLLRPDYLSNAEDAPDSEEIKMEPLDCSKPKNLENEMQQNGSSSPNETTQSTISLNDTASYEETAQSLPNLYEQSASSRVFVFPQKAPGFECIPSTNPNPEQESYRECSYCEKVKASFGAPEPVLYMNPNRRSRSSIESYPLERDYFIYPKLPENAEQIRCSVTVNHLGCPNNPSQRFKHVDTEPMPVTHAIKKADTYVQNAVDTARSVYNALSSAFSSEVYTTRPMTEKRQEGLRILHEMGFPSNFTNETVLIKYNDNLEDAINYLLNRREFNSKR